MRINFISYIHLELGTMGLSAKIQLNDCKGQNDVNMRTVSIAKWAQDKCKATGLVTTSK